MRAVILLLSVLLIPSLALSPPRVRKGGTQTVFTPLPIEGVAEDVEVVRVPVLLGVASRCPNTIFCEDFFDRVLKEVGHDKVDLRLTFIGKCVSTL